MVGAQSTSKTIPFQSPVFQPLAHGTRRPRRGLPLGIRFEACVAFRPDREMSRDLDCKTF